MNDESDETHYSYYPFGSIEHVNMLLQGSAGPVNVSLSYRYNPAGQLEAMTYPSGRVVNYSYDKDRLSSLNTSQDGM